MPKPSQNFRAVQLDARVFLTEQEVKDVLNVTSKLFTKMVVQPPLKDLMYQMGRRRRFHKARLLAAYALTEHEVAEIINRKKLERYKQNEQRKHNESKRSRSKRRS